MLAASFSEAQQVILLHSCLDALLHSHTMQDCWNSARLLENCWSFHRARVDTLERQSDTLERQSKTLWRDRATLWKDRAVKTVGKLLEKSWHRGVWSPEASDTTGPRFFQQFSNSFTACRLASNSFPTVLHSKIKGLALLLGFWKLRNFLRPINARMKEAKAKRHLPYWISLRLVPCLVQLGSGLVPLRSAEFQAPVGPVMSGASTTSTVMVPLMVCNGFKGVLNAMHDKIFQFFSRFSVRKPMELYRNCATSVLNE